MPRLERFRLAIAGLGSAAAAAAVVCEGAFDWMAESAGHCWPTE